MYELGGQDRIVEAIDRNPELTYITSCATGSGESPVSRSDGGFPGWDVRGGKPSRWLLGARESVQDV